MYFPVSVPWARGDQTICEMPFSLQSANHLTFGDAVQERVLRLRRDELLDIRDQGERGADLIGSPLAEPEIADLALPHDLGQRLHRLLEWRLLVVAMALVEIDVVGPQSRERGVDLLEDLLA